MQKCIQARLMMLLFSVSKEAGFVSLLLWYSAPYTLQQQASWLCLTGYLPDLEDSTFHMSKARTGIMELRKPLSRQHPDFTSCCMNLCCLKRAKLHSFAVVAVAFLGYRSSSLWKAGTVKARVWKAGRSQQHSSAVILPLLCSTAV